MMTTELSLTELAQLYQTDKGVYGFDGRTPGHGYAPVYERLFAPLRHEPVAVLELGVAKGASLLMWNEYFSRGTIAGLDISLAAVDQGRPLGVEGGGWSRLDRHKDIRLYQGCQTDGAILRGIVEQLGGWVDLVIDDGSHQNAHQQTTFQTLYPFVRPGGFYVIEDVHAGRDEADATVPHFTQRMLDGQLHEAEWCLWLIRQRTSQTLIIKKRASA